MAVPPKARKSDIPSRSWLFGFTPVDHVDAVALDLPPGFLFKPEELLIRIFQGGPAWVDGLFRLRNKLVKLVGLKGGQGMNEQLAEALRSGKKHGIFSLAHQAADENVLLLQDKHLDCYLSLLVRPVVGVCEGDAPGAARQELVATTLVKYNNSLGKVYFFFIRPFHNIIVPVMLKRAVYQTETRKT